MITVFVVDDHAVVRQGLKTFFGAVHDMSVVGEAASGDEALRHVAEMARRNEAPDVVLLDLKMPGRDGVATARALLAAHSGVRVVVMTSYDETELVRAALAVGSAGYLLKDAHPSEVEAAVRSAMDGETYLDPAVAHRITQRLAQPTSGLGLLTDREREVLVLVAAGASNHDIGRDLGISERTARTHVSNVLLKLGLGSRTQAALLAIREGLAPI